MTREERIEQWVTLLTQAGITQANHDSKEIICANIEGPAVLPPRNLFMIVVPKFQDYLKIWEDGDEFMEIYEGLPKGGGDEVINLNNSLPPRQKLETYCGEGYPEGLRLIVDALLDIYDRLDETHVLATEIAAHPSLLGPFA